MEIFVPEVILEILPKKPTSSDSDSDAVIFSDA